MTTSEIISSVISLLALTISGITAYRTLFAQFRGKIFLKPQIFLVHPPQGPSIVIGCEIINPGAKPGAIDDLYLLVKCRHRDTGSINSYSFLPLFLRDSYSILKPYQESDFESFQSISVPTNSRLTRYVVFNANSANFLPQPGEIELQLFSRCSRSNIWEKADGIVNIEIDQGMVSIWDNPQGQSVIVESKEMEKLRDEIMRKVLGYNGR